ncbi:S46 family peptidase [Inhella sp.]|uniref:S46 family peptidase n=1 Tax=Inhella sp. TaxID=1921806 RepID=UPI0035AE3CD5
MKTTLPLISLLALAGPALAAEGMWMPQQLPQLAKSLKAAGLALSPNQLADLSAQPLGAVVALPGCSGSFVSAQGLVVTNHHCAYGSIQFNSTPQRDLLAQGFLARSLSEELPAEPGTRLRVTVAARDVSAQVLDAPTRALQGKARSEAIERHIKRLVAECEQDAGHRCSVPAFFGGLQYQLIKQLEIRDVRLVHAPADMVGRFGGDTDNWVWPRHTGDYSFYRAYVGADGKPADFHQDNQPYRPQQVLKLAQAPLNEGDFVMVAGYPGRTNRYRLPAEVEHGFGWQHPALIKAYGEHLDLIKQATTGRRDAEIKLADTVASLGNAMQNWQGQQRSFANSDLLARKQAEQAALTSWVQADAQRQARFGPSLQAVEQLLAEQQARERRDLLVELAEPTPLRLARGLYQQAKQRQLPDAERRLGFQERDQKARRQRLAGLDRRYDETTEKRVVAHFLLQLMAQPQAFEQQPLLKALGLQPGMDAAAVAAQMDALYAGSPLLAERLQWFERGSAAYEASSDPFIAAAVALHADDEARLAQGKELGGRLQQAYANVMQALIEFKASQGQAVYPDANSTLRVGHGRVQGRPGPDGAQWSAFTTLRGIPEKHQGQGDFDTPAAQLKAIQARQFDRYAVKALDSVPVNFLASLDTTGGSSGSPVLNARGELVGLLFDGTSDAVISDWDFNTRTTRSIGVDLRYMLWQMKVVDGAANVLKELGVQ